MVGDRPLRVDLLLAVCQLPGQRRNGGCQRGSRKRRRIRVIRGRDHKQQPSDGNRRDKFNGRGRDAS